MEKKYKLINYSIDVDTSILPNLMKSIIDQMEVCNKKDDWLTYDSLFNQLEVCAKHTVMNGVISEQQFDSIMNRYGGY